MISGLIYSLGLTIGIVTLAVLVVIAGVYYLLKRKDEQKMAAIRIRSRDENLQRLRRDR